MLDQQNVDLFAEQHFPLCGTSVAGVDPGLLRPCQPESLDRRVDKNAGLSRAGCGATEFVDDNLGAGCCATELVDHLGIDPPQGDWAGIPLAQDGPWLRGVVRNYIEVSFFLGLGPSIMWGRCLCLVVIVPYVALAAFFTRPPLRSYLVRAGLWKPL